MKLKTRWCNYLTALENINYMPIRKDRCYKNYGSHENFDTRLCEIDDLAVSSRQMAPLPGTSS